MIEITHRKPASLRCGGETKEDASGVVLEGATRGDIAWSEFEPYDGGLVLPASAFPEHRRSYSQWAVQYLDAVLAREPSFACLGLHEWAMVYRDPNVRHPILDLAATAIEPGHAVPNHLHDNCPSCEAVLALGRLRNCVEWTLAPGWRRP